jgi:hypothetical protein
MKAELREQLGNAGYQATKDNITPWEQQDEETKELYRQRGEAAVAEFVALVTPLALKCRDLVIPLMNDEQREVFVSSWAALMAAVEE